MYCPCCLAIFGRQPALVASVQLSLGISTPVGDQAITRQLPQCAHTQTVALCLLADVFLKVHYANTRQPASCVSVVSELCIQEETIVYCGCTCARARCRGFNCHCTCALQKLGCVHMMWSNAGAQPGTFGFMLDEWYSSQLDSLLHHFIAGFQTLPEARLAA